MVHKTPVLLILLIIIGPKMPKHLHMTVLIIFCHCRIPLYCWTTHFYSFFFYIMSAFSVQFWNPYPYGSYMEVDWALKWFSWASRKVLYLVCEKKRLDWKLPFILWRKKKWKKKKGNLLSSSKSWMDNCKVNTALEFRRVGSRSPSAVRRSRGWERRPRTSAWSLIFVFG